MCTIMAGEADKIAFKRRAEQLAAAVKGIVLQIIAGAGHMVHHEGTRAPSASSAGLPKQ